MNGHGREPPDEHESDAIALENESIISEVDIKQEPTIKQENESPDEILMVSRSIHPAIGSLDNSIGGAESDVSDGCFDFYNLDEVTSKVKIEKVENGVYRAPWKESDEYENSKDNGNKHLSKQKSSESDGNARKNYKTNRLDKEKKPIEGKANGKRHKCSFCDYDTSHKGHWKTHMFKHTGERPFPCSLCQKRFTTKQRLQSHMKAHVDEFLFSCSNCSQGFDRSEEKVEHESGCKVRRYECHLCKELSTLDKTDLKRHLRVHTGERPFECDQCSKRFNQSSALKLHRKTHTNPRPRPLKIKCSSCFKIFAQQKEKENHEANCKRRGYRCDLCKSYTTHLKPNLMSHMRIHTGEKPFRCEICSKRFLQKAHLNQHQKIHK